MKARLSRTSALGTLNPMQKEAVHIYVEQLWRQKQEIISHRFLLAMCLALNDIYHFGDKRLAYIMRGVEDILSAYAEDSFTPSEARGGSIDNGGYDEMAVRMQAELSSRRGIHTKIIEVIEDEEG